MHQIRHHLSRFCSLVRPDLTIFDLTPAGKSVRLQLAQNCKQLGTAADRVPAGKCPRVTVSAVRPLCPVSAVRCPAVSSAPDRPFPDTGSVVPDEARDSEMTPNGAELSGGNNERGKYAHISV